MVSFSNEWIKKELCRSGWATNWVGTIWLLRELLDYAAEGKFPRIVESEMWREGMEDFI